MRKEYLSDQELTDLIAELEQKEMLNPPEYLEAEIFEKVGIKQDTQDKGCESQKQDSRKLGSEEPQEMMNSNAAHGTEHDGIELFWYSCKIALAAAAAIIAIIQMPSATVFQPSEPVSEPGWQQEYRRDSSVLERITGSFYEQIDHITEKMTGAEDKK